jgi:phosphate/sulfate permease
VIAAPISTTQVMTASVMGLGATRKSLRLIASKIEN